jgi:gliding motility-associated-like protein
MTKKMKLAINFFLLFILPLTSYPAIFTVDNTGDADDAAAYVASDGTNTLRKCIRLANSNAGTDSIYFNIAAGPYLTTAATALPVITSPVFIDGLTQAGASAGNPLIEIDGGGLNVLEIAAGGGGSTIKGLILYGSNRGIYINSSSGNTVIANHIGTNQGATAVAPAVISWNGIEIGGNSSDNIIGGTGGINTRNIISGANEQGIRIQGTSTGTQIMGNYIGTNFDATAAIANAQNGIFLLAGSNNSIIGGITIGHRNIISRNGQRGIFIQNSSNCIISNNFIGTTITGNAALGNIGKGIEIENNSNDVQITNNLICSNAQQGLMITSNSHRPLIQGNSIGLGLDGNTQLGNTFHGMEIQNSLKPTIGGSLVSERNYVSNNAQFGIRLENGDSANIKGNYIGVDGSGLLDHGNSQVGLYILLSDDVQIGGALADEGNIISGNNQRGLVIENNSPRPVIKGNKIGLGADGAAQLGNGQHGMHIINSVKPVIGGSLATERNYISNNAQFGLRVENGDSAIIKGNYIGVDGTGLLDHGNSQVGLYIILSDDVSLGGTLAGEGNIIGGNNERGVVIENSSARPVIKGNKIGLGADGLAKVGNGQHGMHIINSIKPVIGGNLVNERNYVSNNGQFGVRIENGDSAVIKGNYIGVDLAGAADHGNSQVGLYIINSDDIILGGSLAGEGNIVSGNNERGVVVENSPGPVIKGNIIGLGADGIIAIGNGQQGLHIITCSTAVVGGSLITERNYVSENGGSGIQLVGSPYSIIKGNYVGVDVTGLLNKGNNNNGILLDNCRESIIGGGSANERNISCGSKAANGIEINGDSKRCVIQGNFSGIGADGVTDIGNWINGINIYWTSDTLIIGGSNYMERNVFSCNGKSGMGDGLRVEGPDGHTILGNFCGVDSTGTIKKGNAWAGLSLNESNDNIVGGSGAFEGNICSGNLNEGVWLRNASRNRFYGNFIGTDRTGTLQLGNEDWGFAISDQGSGNFDNIIGGPLTEANTIAYNLNIDPIRGGQGVYVDNSSHRNLITFNKIYCNAGLGIDKNGAGNENISPPVILSSLANEVSGTGISGDSIHVYRNSRVDAGTQCDCEGEIYLGQTIVDASGNWTLTHNLGLSFAEARTVTATQTNLTFSTSEFSNCLISCDLMPTVQASDTLINMFNPVVINLTSSATPNPLIPNPIQYFWSLNTPDTTGTSVFATDSSATFDLSSGNFQVSSDGNYKIYLIVSQVVCIDTAFLEIRAYQIPNLVTPNNDGLNDTWQVTKSPQLFDAEIYNSWGKLIFSKEGYTNDWNTSDVTDGTYYYLLKGKAEILGNYKGWVQVIKDK